MIKILIIGKNSFIAKNILANLKKNFSIEMISFLEFTRLNKNSLSNFNYIINCSISKNYINKKYSDEYDLDFQIAKKIHKTSVKMIFLSTRKVYKSGENLNEYSELKPNCFYSKNKLISENKLKKILPNRILILRISNLIGKIDLKKSNRKVHYTFIDNFFFYIKKNIIFDNKGIYKDFISIDKFSEILKKLIINNINGVFNISIGEKIFVKEIIDWLNFYNSNKYLKKMNIPNNFNIDNFYLNNTKLKNTIKISISKKHLKKYCIMLSKSFFMKKKFY